MKKFSVFTLIALLCLSLTAASPGVWAADAAQTSTTSTRRHLSTIVMAGLAGAILGLSTLSFYGRPQDRLSNIAVGCAFGIIGGAFYTTYKAATEPKDFYGVDNFQPEAWTMAETERTPPGELAFKPSFVFTF